MSAALVIGIDESGKGDFFGPLVVAGLACHSRDERLLAAIGARDSKAVADRKLLEIDQRLRAEFPHEVLILSPEEYNRRWEACRNLNRLLAELHADVILRLCGKIPATRAVSDKFGKAELLQEALEARGCDIDLRQLIRGEAVPQVAAASMLARAAFIREMHRLSAQVGLELPKGAAPKVDEAGRRLVQRMGPEILRRVAKVHFKNYRRVIDPRLAV